MNKAPEEIKCGMECIRTNAERICVKTEKGQCPRCEQIVQDHINLIHYLESRLAQAELERDAAVADLKNVGCCLCKHAPTPDLYIHNECHDCVRNCNFEWRGVCPENTKEDAL